MDLVKIVWGQWPNFFHIHRNDWDACRAWCASKQFLIWPDGGVNMHTEAGMRRKSPLAHIRSSLSGEGKLWSLGRQSGTISESPTCYVIFALLVRPVMLFLSRGQLVLHDFRLGTFGGPREQLRLLSMLLLFFCSTFNLFSWLYLVEVIFIEDFHNYNTAKARESNFNFEIKTKTLRYHSYVSLYIYN